ncbi:AAA family ATPase [Actinoplanes missouriensis]|uniref:AAA family ATPase n=1 Tax=Actinoplanes missouriensis TaxID=1866 RepID=UPI0033C4D67F
MGAHEMVEDGTAMIGRGRELAHFTAVVDAAEHGAASLFLCGDAGIGKSLMLSAATTYARRRGFRIVVLTSESRRPFGLWRELIGPGRLNLSGLPSHLRHTLAALWKSRPGTAPADEPAVVTGVLLALEALACDAPALVVADDIHRADRESLWLLAEVSRHLSTERVALLSAAPDHAVPYEFTAGLPRYRLRPLTEDNAARLLDSRPVVMTARRRREILRRAEGNPLALCLLSDDADDMPPPMSMRALPPLTRSLLLHAALADDAEHIDTLTRAAGAAPDLSDWAPAERSGLIAVRHGAVRFRSPLTRAACIAGRAPGEVRTAHRNVAEATPDPYRRAHHLAEISAGPDEALAARLEAATSGASDFAAAAALLSAAERSPDGERAARRYAQAVFAACRSGEPGWAIELYEKATSAMPDPDMAAVAACGAAFALVQSAQPGQAFHVASRAAQRGPRDEQIALLAINLAAGSALATGVAAHREQLIDLLAAVRPGRTVSAGVSGLPPIDITLTRAAILAVSDPAGYAAAGVRPAPAATAAAEPIALTTSGLLAFMLDDSATAATDLHAAWVTGSRTGSPGITMTMLHLLVIAMIDSGRWSEVDELLDDADQLGTVRRAPLLQKVAPALRALIHALRHGEPADRLAGVPTLPGSTFVDSLTQRAAGITALAAGEYEQAYLHFRRMFDEDGRPRHYFLGPRSLPQLALTAVRTRHAGEARRILILCRDAAGPAPTARMTMLLAHSAALLDDSLGAEEHFQQALADPECASHWPLEYAEAQLNLGLWLRSRRRTHEARPYLLTARDTFLRLGARAHADQAHRGLPVGLLPTGDSAASATTFTALTAQKQMIARMAVSGMSNREIAERLFLSPRTVGSHLYRIYAELGVGNRHQLRSLIEASTAPLPIGA